MDVNLFYEEKGSGEYLILLHGNGESHEYFEKQIEEFSKNFHVVAVDTRGHGKSPRGEAPFSIKQFAEDLNLFMEEHSIEKANILGFSDGGNVALEFALKYSRKIEKLILNGANLNPGGVKRRYQFPIEIGYKMAKFFARKNQGAVKNAETLALMVNEPNIAPSELRKINNKTLVIVGTNDMVKESHSRLIYENLPNADLAFIKGNHFIAHENPKEFNDRVSVFLNK